MVTHSNRGCTPVNDPRGTAGLRVIQSDDEIQVYSLQRDMCQNTLPFMGFILFFLAFF